MASFDDIIGHDPSSPDPSSEVPQSDAVQFINYYRQGLAAGSLRSVWIDDDIINFIVNAYAAGLSISGIRVYLAKYKQGVGETQDVDPNLPAYVDTTTAILALTQTTQGVETDIVNAYFNYGKPCPPYCTGDVGNS